MILLSYEVHGITVLQYSANVNCGILPSNINITKVGYVGGTQLVANTSTTGVWMV